MKLFGTLSCVVGSSLLVFAIISCFAPKIDPGSWLFTSKLRSTHISYGGNSAKNDQPEVILINEQDRGFASPCCGFGMGAGRDDLRELAEKEFRNQNFREAAKQFEAIVQSNPNDTRSRLGLGKSYVALHNFDDAILFLSTVRNECNHERHLDKDGATQFCSTPSEFSNLTGLPEVACEALDHEARVALETAVTATIKPKLPDSDSVAAFKNDRHFQVLNASLQLAKRYHEKSQLEQLKAMYQLARENTRTLPIELVTACSAHEQADEKKWQELARASLNGAVEEERNWYLDRLAIVSEAFPEGDIKKAAVNHVLLRNNQESNACLTHFFDADSLKSALHSQPSRYALLLANCSFDCGLRSYKNRNSKKAREFFLLARDVYSRFGTAKDVADTNYNLGIVSYQLERITEAKQYFKLAAGIFKGKTRFEEHQLKAAFNYGILAVDNAEAGDEEYLSNLYDQTHHPEAATLLGLLFLKNNDFEKAYVPFKHASAATFPEPQVETPQLPDEPNYRASGPKHQDRTFTDDQVLQALFVRQKPIEESVSSRFASRAIDTAQQSEEEDLELQQLTKEKYPSFENAVSTLYPSILRKTNRLEELQAFFHKKHPRHRMGKPMNRERQYRSLLGDTLRKTWFCPPHMASQEIIVHARMTREGTLSVSQDDAYLIEFDPVNTSVGESIKWTVLPMPPPSFAGKEFILVYNASKRTGARAYGMPAMGYRSRSKFEW